MRDVLDLLRRASTFFDQKVEQIKDDQWEDATPCTDWDVKELVRHMVYENLWIPPLLKGETADQVGDRYDGDILGNDPKAAWREAHRHTTDALQIEGAIDKTVHLSRGETRAEEYFWELFMDHLIHGWDLARAIGADEKMEPELINACYDYVREREAAIRASGLYGDRQTTPADADRQTELLAIVGRKA
ncbi:MAG: TIGR03086 family metal-binding protein [Actinomycetota bacterium]